MMTITDLAALRRELERRRADLQARRPSLALPAARGDVEARTALVDVDRRLGEIARELDLLDLARDQAEREAADARRRAEEERRARLKADLARAEAARDAAYRQADTAAAPLLAAFVAALEAAGEMDRLAARLAEPVTGVAIPIHHRGAALNRLRSFLATRLWDLAPATFMPLDQRDMIRRLSDD